MSIAIGIDPGMNGGIAVLPMELGLHHAWIMPVAGDDIDAERIADLLEMVIQPLDRRTQVHCYIEKVGAMPKQGVSSTFKFGCGWGMVRGVCSALRLPYRLVTPQAWKKVILAGTAKDKDAAVAFCRQAYPHINLFRTERCTTPHDGMADAICIAEYARRLNLITIPNQEKE